MLSEITPWLDAHPAFWVLFIVAARIVDVSIGTMRTIMVVRGYRWIAAILGFCEVVIWVVAISGVLHNLSLMKVLAYGTGFALGNACGIWIEQKVAIGEQLVMIISDSRTHAVAFGLRLADFVVTEVAATRARGDAAMCFVVVPRRETTKVIRLAKTVDADASIVVEDIRDTPYTRLQTGLPRSGWRALLKKK